jgi:hypothetical protein
MAFKRTRKVLSYVYAVSSTTTDYVLDPELFVGDLINGIVPCYAFNGSYFHLRLI